MTELEHAAIAEQHLLRTEVAAFVDGVPHRAEVTVVDPGAGHLLADWRDTGRRLAAAASPHAAAYICGWFTAYEDSEFVTS